MAQTYSVRGGALERPGIWTLTEDELIEQATGRGERRHPLSELRSARLINTPSRFGSPRYVLALTFARGRATLLSHPLVGVGRSEDQLSSFTAFARTVCQKAAMAAPKARFITGRAAVGTPVDWVIGLLGVGVVALLGAAASAGFFALGLELASRLSFVLCLLLALRPWMGDSRGRSFDPRAIPAEVLP